MTNEEIVIEIQAGRAELLPALWEGVRRFIWKQAYKAASEYYRRINAPMPQVEDPGCVFYDFYNSGFLAVEEASRKYKPDDGVLFVSYLGWHIKKQFSQVKTGLYDGWSRSSRECIKRDIAAKKVDESVLNIDSLNRQILNEDSDDAIEQIDLVADTSDFVEEYTERAFLDSLHNKLETLLNRLDPDESKTIRLRYYGGYSHEKIALLCGMTQEQTAVILRRALDNLRCMAAQGELDEYIERRTNYYTRVGVNAFQNTGVSAVEQIVFKREEMRSSMLEKMINRKGGNNNDS